jgi:vitamin B12 transporter
MRKFLFLSAAAVAFAPALADQPVETVVVSATRSEQKASLTGETVTVITGEDLATRQSVFLIDALQSVPGLAVNRTGGPGQIATVSIRGAATAQTVALIDGVRLNDPSEGSGSVLFGDLAANGVARIEVLSGAQSTLYGSDAIGGVVNILTRRGGDTPFALIAGAEGGSYQSWRLSAAANGTVARTEYGAAVSFAGSKGISAADSRLGNVESDGTRNISATLNTRTQLGEGVSLDLRGYYSHAHSQFDDNYGWTPPYAPADSAAYSINAFYGGYVGLNGDFLGGRFKNRLALIAIASKRDFYDSGSDTLHLNYGYDGGAVRLEYQGIVNLSDALEAIFGAESELTSFGNDSYYSYMPAERLGGRKRISGGYAEVQHTLFETLTLTGGVRIDDDEKFGAHTSLKFAAAWQVPQWDAVLHANYGDGFKAPSLYQLYSAYSNPAATLKPEAARGWEAGIDKTAWDGRLRLSLTWFQRFNSNEIGFQNCYAASDAPGCPLRLAQYGYYDNIARSKASGIETGASVLIADGLKLTLDYTNMDAIDRTTGKDLPHRPHEMANAAVTWQALDGVDLGAALHVTGKRFDDAADSRRLTAATQFDLFGAVALDGHWQLYGRIENLFDDRTERVSYYGTPGIAATMGVRAKL